MHLTSRRRWPQNVILLAFVALVAAPIVFYGCGEEIALWRAAAILRSSEEQQPETLLEPIRSIAQQAPENLDVQLVVADLLLRSNRTEEALAYCKQLADRFPKSGRAAYALVNCLMVTGQLDAALAQYEASVSPVGEIASAGSFAEEQQVLLKKNGLAYFRALAGRQLPEALQDIQEVIGYWDNRWSRASGLEIAAQLRGSLCSAILYRRGGKPAQAVDVLSAPVTRVEAELNRFERQFRRSTADWLTQPFPPNAEGLNRLGAQRNLRAQLVNALSAMLVVRSLAHQDLQHGELSRADRQRVEQLGWDPERLFAMLPDADQAALEVCVASDRIQYAEQPALPTYLDTRGCVLARLGRPLDALRDFTVAIEAIDAYLQVGIHSRITNSQWVTTAREFEQQYVVPTRHTLAVVLFHRSVLLRRLGQSLLADQDDRRIRELGFTPGAHLF